jgi:hypothetical protein
MFTHIPHDEEGEDPCRNIYGFAKKHPHTTAKQMDRCKDMLTMFYEVHQTMVGRSRVFLEEITRSTPTQEFEGESS